MKIARFVPQYSGGNALFVPQWMEEFAAPVGLTGTKGPNNILWTWSAVPTAVGYLIECGPQGGPFVVIDVGSSLSYNQTNLTPAAPYRARVSAYK